MSEVTLRPVKRYIKVSRERNREPIPKPYLSTKTLIEADWLLIRSQSRLNLLSIVISLYCFIQLNLMDTESLGNNTTKAPRKVKFAPKVPRRVTTPVVPKIEKNETIAADDEAQAQELLRRFNEASLKAHPKPEKKAATTQVAFGFGGSSTKIKSYGSQKSGIGIKDHEGPSSEGGSAYSSGSRVNKDYNEPWDYYSNYPVTLPLRRPYSGNPELLDEEEFGEDAESITLDEDLTKAARELGLMEENPEASMFFLQLPPNLPMVKQSPNAPETASSSKPPNGAGPKEKTCTLDELPKGFMGKMLVYKSGAVKLKLGDTIYDVSAGVDCVFAQEVVAINTEEKHCCVVGELSKRAVITPDVDSILNSMSDSL